MFKNPLRPFREFKELTPARFDTTNHRWVSASADTIAAANVRASELRCLTFNVWFGEYFFEERCAALLELVEENKPDIVALQEVTTPFLERLLAHPYIQSNFIVSDCSGKTLNSYGVLLLSRYDLQNLRWYPLPGNMGRSTLIGDVMLNGTTLTIATVHLESHRISAPVRAKQLSKIFPLLDQSSHALLMGDFNFCASWKEENDQLPPQYADAWNVLHPQDPGYTEDTDINIMRLRVKREQKQVRFDRILLRSKGTAGCWVPRSIELLGTSPIQVPTADIFPSDHFGLMATLTRDDSSK